MARLQWLLMTLAVPVLAAAIVMIRFDNAGTGEPTAAASSFVILGALILFAFNVVRSLAKRAQAPAAQPAE